MHKRKETAFKCPLSLFVFDLSFSTTCFLIPTVPCTVYTDEQYIIIKHIELQEESTQVPEPSKPESLKHNQSKLESSEPESIKPESCQTFSSSHGVTLPTPQHLGKK